MKFNEAEKRWIGILSVVIPVLAFLFMPTAGLFNYETYQSNQYTTAIRVTGWKFIDCTYVAGVEQPFIRESKSSPWTEALHFRYAEDPYPGSSKPAGHHNFGLWIWTHNKQPYQVKLRVEHDCWGMAKTSNLGPFNVEIR